MTTAITIREIEEGASRYCAPILRTLTAWFGLPDANQHYMDFVDNQPTLVAFAGEQAVGFLALKQHFSDAAEIYVMGVARDQHRGGIGRALVEAAEDQLRAKGTRYLQVKTLSERDPDVNYAKTRQFYLAMGFAPLEEFPDLWPGNPALQLVKYLAPAD